ncbi:hypothetical protein DFH08DRAFT_709364 [Mycena albidolilacea]|uniref:ATP-dependent DNA helicase n=1 Tax=Mycena albidolilacea TaxID=1033008 RepID=A0AAD7EJ04_9AGAR|nr:hypothetical protein DFH08DRAFT_709364 [Mycena albidolilacea]
MKSMIGRTQMGRSDRGLWQIYPAMAHETLGGLATIIFGDFLQLPPVGDSALFSTKESPGPHGQLATEGREAYESFNKSIILTEFFHQQGDSPAQIAFRDALMHLRNYNTTAEDYAMYSTQFWHNLSLAEQDEFEGVLHLLPTGEAADIVNKKKLAVLNMPVVCCKAQHHRVNIAKSRKASAEDAEGLEPEIYLAEEAHIMITHNLWPSKGLVNRTQGVVKKIWYLQGTNPKKDLPAVMFVQCPEYTGMY